MHREGRLQFVGEDPIYTGKERKVAEEASGPQANRLDMLDSLFRLRNPY